VSVISSTSVITMCSANHESVWTLTAPRLIQHVQATDSTDYCVYVPSDKVSDFYQATPKEILVKAESDLGRDFEKSLKNKVLSSGNEERYKWYLQQFYKLEALRRSTSDISIIWDADCVPLRSISLVSPEGSLRFMDCSKEHHRRYFENTKRLIGVGKQVKFSFVAPGFPIRRQWIDEFFSFVEDRHQKSWHSAIMDSIDFRLRSGFSEFETLGTWIASNYVDEWSLIDVNWERFGQRRFGKAIGMNQEQLEQIRQRTNIDIISFENWDIPLLRRVGNRLRDAYARYS